MRDCLFAGKIMILYDTFLQSLRWFGADSLRIIPFWKIKKLFETNGWTTGFWDVFMDQI